MADVNVLDLSEVTPGSGDSLILFDRATGAATSTRFDTLKSAVTGDVAATVAQHTSDIQTLTNETSDIVNVLGAKNLLPNNATTQIINRVQFTVNANGSVGVNRVGTSDSNATIDICSSLVISALSILSGCPIGGGLNEHALVATDGTNYYSDTGDGVEIPAGTYRVFILIYSASTISNKTFYPMIRPASIKDDTYVPYAMTNRELTKSISDLMGNYVVSWLKYKHYDKNTSITNRQFLYNCTIDFLNNVIPTESSKGNRVLPLEVSFLNTRFKADMCIQAYYPNSFKLQDETTGDNPNVTYGMRMYDNTNYCYLSKKTFSANGVTYINMTDSPNDSALDITYLVLRPIKYNV